MKKHWIILVLASTIWLIYTAGCERDRSGDPIELFVQNVSNDTIVVAQQYTFPDTSLINYKETSARNGMVVYPNDENKFWAFSGWRQQIIERNVNGVITLVIYSMDTIRKYPFEKIQEDYNTLARFDLTIEELETQNWTITYP